MSPRVFVALAVLVLVGCERPPDEGIAVGNPGKASMTLALAAADGFAFEAAEVPVGAVGLEDCDGAAWQDQPGVVADLLGPEAFELQAGTWCSLAVQWDGLLQARGTWTQDAASGDFELHLDLQDLLVDAVVQLDDGGAVYLELAAPEWLADLELTDGELAVIDAAAADHAALVAAVESGSNLFVDDGDGVLSPQERVVGPVAGTVPAEFFPSVADGISSDRAAGCSCTAGGSGASLLALLLLAVRRRR
jgi:uncharacterized protein (TIGR03382 family)